MPAAGFGVGIKFSFLNFVLPRGTKTRFENRSRHKLKRCAPRPLFFLFPWTANQVFIFLSSRTMLADLSSAFSFSHLGQFIRFETILSPRTVYLCMTFLLG
jgi:hypothetical protein